MNEKLVDEFQNQVMGRIVRLAYGQGWNVTFTSRNNRVEALFEEGSQYIGLVLLEMDNDVDLVNNYSVELEEELKPIFEFIAQYQD